MTRVVKWTGNEVKQEWAFGHEQSRVVNGLVVSIIKNKNLCSRNNGKNKIKG